jgi:hypothetical protein
MHDNDGGNRMEQKKIPGILKILRWVGGASCVLLGLYFAVVAMLCWYVDGVHVLGYTLFPALALLCFFLAWLLLKKLVPRKPKAE